MQIRYINTWKAELARQLVDNANLSWPRSSLRAIFVLKARVLGEAQAPRVEASQGVYCPGFIQKNTTKKTKKQASKLPGRY